METAANTKHQTDKGLFPSCSHSAEMLRFLLVSLQFDCGAFAPPDIPHDDRMVWAAWEQNPLDWIPTQCRHITCKESWQMTINTQQQNKTTKTEINRQKQVTERFCNMLQKITKLMKFTVITFNYVYRWNKSLMTPNVPSYSESNWVRSICCW